MPKVFTLLVDSRFFFLVRMAPKSWSQNTFGWARAEVLGALVNAVFLIALCFSITVESMKRLSINQFADQDQNEMDSHHWIDWLTPKSFFLPPIFLCSIYSIIIFLPCAQITRKPQTRDKINIDPDQPHCSLLVKE